MGMDPGSVGGGDEPNDPVVIDPGLGGAGRGNAVGGSGSAMPSVPLSSGAQPASCGCSVPGRGHSGWALLLGLLALRGRRRRPALP
jgi:MYXO-CTERM domain-containing protein